MKTNKPYRILNRQCIPNYGYCIEYNDQEYITDITVKHDMNFRTEFAVFKSVDNQITFENALPLYKIMDVGLDFKTLEECIDKFIQFINQ